MTLSRRGFARLVTGAAAAVSVGSLPLFIPSRLLGAEAPSNRLRVAQIGCGRIAQGHDVPAVLKSGLADYVAVCDLDSRRMTDSKEQMAALPPWVMQLFGIVQGVVAGFCGTFWWALVLWLLSKVAFKSQVGFLKALEASGLTMMIFALSVVITTLLVVVLGNLMARPALSVFLNEFDATSKVHLLLGSVNLFYLWSTAVLALALSKLSNVPFGKAAAWFFAFWAVSRVLFVMIGLGGFVM